MQLDDALVVLLAQSVCTHD